MTTLPDELKADIEAIGSLDVIPAILDVVCHTTGMGFAAVARVTDDRWITCALLDNIGFGLKPGDELKVETTICHEVHQKQQPIVIDHVAEDPDFAGHPTPALYGFQSYISVPIMLKNGNFFGTLCAIDPNPARLKNKETVAMFKLYADLISLHLHNLDQLKISEGLLKEEKRIAEWREQFIAILGHDLRNPAGAVKNVAELLQMDYLDEAGIKRFAGVLLKSSFRMLALIDNIMDFARGRLGSGIVLARRDELLGEVLNHVIDELQLVWPLRVIHVEADLALPVFCDSKRIAQMFSNLIGNALAHGDPETAVYVRAVSNADNFVLTVKNSGEPIPPNKLGSLFEPFARGENNNDNEGLGLGLYISKEIAKSHGGTITVTSDAVATTFTFQMPLVPVK